jgi:hypothetical protein
VNCQGWLDGSLFDLGGEKRVCGVVNIGRTGLRIIYVELGCNVLVVMLDMFGLIVCVR